jgi:hypothetical protein
VSEPFRSDDPPLTAQQQQMMAYVDDELSPSERTSFEQVMGDDSELAMETARHKNLLDLSRSMALMEPSDREVRRFWARLYNRSEWRLGWCLFIGGLIVLVGEGIYLLVSTNQLEWYHKVALFSVLAGAGILLWNTVRLRLRTSRFDRYRGVMR